MIRKTYLTALMLLWGTGHLLAQETLDANDPGTYIFGGDQKSNTATLELLEVSLVDLEPEQANGLVFGVAASEFEAGLPATSGDGSGVNESLWLNFTSRVFEGTQRTIMVFANQPLPQGITIRIELLNLSSVGGNGANGTGSGSTIILSDSSQEIITAIGGGSTGHGEGSGFQLRYSYENTGSSPLPAGFEIIYQFN